ncbi:flagellar export protein FliJ [Crenobacter cavernae]|uniref:Flagellar FliJ protein n=1 Tax=Crenobacter cavernae TaxID=2290923 RepID=A0A345Y781_9NEIS|nr:flagellar export protein FliJ [Crenobacter cavernae]AXK39783.1 flagellar export protein FliJ [Crenobacter cavernae]
MADSKYRLLQQLAKEREAAAAERMQRAQGRLGDARQRLEQLEAYRDEYRGRFTARGQAGVGVAQWQDFRLFLGKLDEAVGLQNGEVERCLQRLLMERQGWQNERKRVMAFDKLMEREAERAALKENRREQKAMDEFASRQFWNATRGKGR